MTRFLLLGSPTGEHASSHTRRLTELGEFVMGIDEAIWVTEPDWLRTAEFSPATDRIILCTDDVTMRDELIRASRAGAIEVHKCGLPVHGLKMREPGRPEGSAAVRVRLDYDEISNADLANRFTYHPPSAVQIPVFEQIRAEGHGLAQFIKDNTPPSPEQYRAIEAVETAVMLANAALARHGSDS